jgi:hypothetical protein
LKEKLARTSTYTALIFILAVGVLAVAANANFVLAQPCQAQLGSPSVSPQPYYYGPDFQVTVPVSASCSFYAGQLYASGTAYDTIYNTNIGTANTVLTSTYAGYGYTGQLTFTLPISEQSRPVQFLVSVYGTQNGYYGGPYGGLLAQTLATFVVGPSYYQGYPLYPSYTPSTPSYPVYPTYPAYPAYAVNPYNSGSHYYQNQGGNYYMRGFYNYYYNGGIFRNSNYCRPTSPCYPR